MFAWSSLVALYTSPVVIMHDKLCNLAYIMVLPDALYLLLVDQELV